MVSCISGTLLQTGHQDDSMDGVMQETEFNYQNSPLTL